MSDRFHPIPMPDLVRWLVAELAADRSVFGYPLALAFTPSPRDPFRTRIYSHELDTPVGVAAGPHTQLAQNIVLAWLAGARVIELKTVQVLDQLEICKPCINMQDEGYNVEWSQELTIDQSIDEYVRAWVLVHALHRLLGHPGPTPGVLFNMSVGYDLAGVQSRKVRHFVDTMGNASDLIAEHRDRVVSQLPELRDLHIPTTISDSVTLSTMHGCPPDEIGRISRFLMDEWGLHTSVKLNPTLLGPDQLRELLNHRLGYRHIRVPDQAFAHDLELPVAIELIRELEAHARRRHVVFGVKLTNTLEVEHAGEVFAPDQQTMYLSGRPLHALSAHVALRLGEVFDGGVMMSFAGGADAFNLPHLMAAGMVSVTTCSDLLRPGGYSRLPQYLDELRSAMAAHNVDSLEAFIVAEAARAGDPVSCGQAAALGNLRRYAASLAEDQELHRDSFERRHTKTDRGLGLFDCIEAPCTDACFVDQRVPEYIRAVAAGDMPTAVAVTRDDNPLPTVLGRACNHPCEPVCVRTHYDRPLAIREIKRFIMAHEETPPAAPSTHSAPTARVAVIGGGPCGLAAASFLARSGVAVTVFEAQPYAGGMVAGTIPGYRADEAVMEQDLAAIRALGVEIRCGVTAGRDFDVGRLLADGFRYVVVATGCQAGMPLFLANGDGPGIIDGLAFLRATKHGSPPRLGPKVAVVGGGDVAMDCARSARRLTGGEVTVLYRRSRAEMPAQREELEDLLTEGISVLELVNPQAALRSPDGELTGLQCIRMRLGDPDDSGRRRPVEIAGSAFSLEVDQLIVAIGQRPQLGFLEADGIALDHRGKVAVDPHTLETSRCGVFAGGDAVDLGPLSIVRACGDGRRIAATVIARESGAHAVRRIPTPTTKIDRGELLRKRSRRLPRVAAPQLAAEDRSGFDQVLQTLEPAEAAREAARCLDCDLMCGTCEGVCPNHAIFSYRSTPGRFDLPRLVMAENGLSPRGVAAFHVNQSMQVAVLSDFCNECGNCATFCPTAGAPYRHKPRLYLDAADFASQSHNAFMITQRGNDWMVKARWNGNDHRLERGHAVVYHSPAATLHLEPESLALVHAELKQPLAEGVGLDLEACAIMLALLAGISEGAPGLPLADFD